MFFVIIGIAAAVVIASRWSNIGQLAGRVTTALVMPAATQVSGETAQRSEAKLASVKATPSEALLSAEVQDVIPVHTSIGSVYFVGEIVNTGQHAVAKPEAIIALLDAEGKRVAFRTGYSIHDVIPPNEAIPVAVLFTDPPANWQSFEVFLQVQAPTGREFMAYTDFTSPEATISQDEFGYYVVSGIVQNNGSARAEFVQAVVRLYGQDKKIVGMGSAYIEQSILDPGESSSFAVRIMNVAAPATFYRLQFVGHAKPTKAP